MRLAKPWRFRLRTATACAVAFFLIAAWTLPDSTVLVQAQASRSAGGDWTSHWRRETGAPPGTSYAGTSACAECHSSIVNAQARTDMAQAAIDAQSGAANPKGSPRSYQDGPYKLRVELKSQKLIYSATDGSTTLTVPVRWIFGLGKAGQTYILDRDGEYYESRVSYFREL